MSATTDRIENAIRIQLAGALPAAVRLELFLTVEQLCRDALQIAAPTDSSAEPDTWLADELYQLHQRLIIDGALGRMLGQPDKPYSHPELAAVHVGFWDAGLAAAREIAATAPTHNAGLDRLMANLRTQFPAARDPALRQELFNTVDEFARAVLQTTPPVSTDAPGAWLTSDLYAEHFRLLMAGTAARLLLQPGKPWSDPKLAAVQAAIWDSLIIQARADFEARAVVDPWQLLMENLRVQLPGSKDSQIRLELFNVVDEACRTVNLWTQTLAVPLVADRPTYLIGAPQGEVIDVLDVSHATMTLSDTVFDPVSRYLDLGRDPTPEDLATPVFVMVRLVPQRTNEISDYLPGNLWAQHHQLLLDGVLARMMAQPAKPYSSPTLATYHHKRFRNFLQEVRVATTGGGRVWRFPSSTTRRTRR